ncbi:hypothetical protein B0T18DRAFT_66631 [Schizothecium vesticola]|uniref:Uncharacterized protein n=1 Tax=Schizothecium vesticola TaxID=314040 RepID=A0AA40KAD4_9PEZI|nr:hypothetical protein B0T18DRAFT_66631 [Schizothecium vesticola]
MLSSTKDPACHPCGTAQHPDPNPFCFECGHHARHDSDGGGHAALIDDHHYPLRYAFAEATDLEDRWNRWDRDFLDPYSVVDVLVLVPFSLDDDDFYQDRDLHRHIWTPIGTGKPLAEPAPLPRCKRHIHGMGYHRPSFDADSHCWDHDSRPRFRTRDHVTLGYFRTSQQTARMTAFFDALRVTENRLMPHPLRDDNPFEHDPAADEEGLDGPMIALAELTATAAANLLLLAYAFETMSNLCCGLQGSFSGGSNKNLAPAQLLQGVREQPAGGCPSPSWQLPLPLDMAA